MVELLAVRMVQFLNDEVVSLITKKCVCLFCSIVEKGLKFVFTPCVRLKK